MEPSPPAAAPPPEPARKSALGFFAALSLLYLPGLAAQQASPALGLAWTEVFAFLLPAAAAAAGSNLRPGRFLLLARRPRPVQLALGALAGAAGFLAGGALQALVSLALPASWVRDFDVARLFQGSPLERAALAVLASAVAPLCEEAAFRGYVQNALRSRYRPAAAIALSALLFAAMHLDPVRFASVLLLGFLFGWLSWRSGSLWPAVAAHVANNAIASALVLGGGEPDSAAPDPRQAALALLAGLAALAAVAAGYRAATPAPPPAVDALAPRDPADPSVRFRWKAVPAGYLLLGMLAAGLLLAIGGLGPRAPG